MICPYCKTENLPGAMKCAACASWMVERAPIREWTRTKEGRMVAGVCRGLADRFGVPVAALRAAFLLSVLLGGWGLVIYAVLWISMPLAPSPAELSRAPPATPPRTSEAAPPA